MSNSQTPEGRLGYLRLVSVLDAALRHLVVQIGGPQIGPGRAKVLESPEALAGPYGFQLHRMADTFLERCPELEQLLIQDDSADIMVTLLKELASGQINSQFSPGELEELHSEVEGMADKLPEYLGSEAGDGLSPLGDALEVDQQSFAREPWRLREAFPVGTLGLHGREINQLEAALGVFFPSPLDHEGSDQYAQAIWPHLLQLSSDPLGIDLPESSKGSRLWGLLELDKPAAGGPATLDQCIDRNGGPADAINGQAGTTPEADPPAAGADSTVGVRIESGAEGQSSLVSSQPGRPRN